MWSAVGLMLLWRAWSWLSAMETAWIVGLLTGGAAIAVLFHHFMFKKTVAKNLRRLCNLPDRVSILAFNSPKGYVLIAFMIALGIALRHSSLDRHLLALVYLGMGGALFLASLLFYRQFHKVRLRHAPCVDEHTDGA